MPGGIALDDPQVVHWLKEQENRFDVILLLADPEPTPWTERTLAEADEICLIGTHDGGRLGRRFRSGRSRSWLSSCAARMPAGWRCSTTHGAAR